MEEKPVPVMPECHFFYWVVYPPNCIDRLDTDRSIAPNFCLYQAVAAPASIATAQRRRS